MARSLRPPAFPSCDGILLARNALMRAPVPDPSAKHHAPCPGLGRPERPLAALNLTGKGLEFDGTVLARSSSERKKYGRYGVHEIHQARFSIRFHFSITPGANGLPKAPWLHL